MASAEYPRQAAPSAPVITREGDETFAVQLQRSLDQLAARRNTLILARSVARALAWGAGLAAAGVLAYRFFLIDGEWWMPAAIVVFALAMGFRNGRLRRGGSFDAARDADNAFDLRDQLSSALAFARPETVRRVSTATPSIGRFDRLRAMLFPNVQFQTSPPAAATMLVPALVHDAAARAVSIEGKVLYQWKFDRTFGVCATLCALLAIFALMPDVWLFRSGEEKKLAATLQAEGKKLEVVAKSIQKNEPPQKSEASELAKRLEKLGRKMQRGRMTKKAALVGLGQLRRDMEKAKGNDRQNAGANDFERLQNAVRGQQMESPAGQKLQESAQDKDLEKAARELEKLADKIESGAMGAKEREQTANDLEKAAQKLREQGGAQNEAAANQLEQAAKALREQNQSGQDGKGKNGQSGQNQGDKQQGGQSQTGNQSGQQQNQQNGQQQNGQSGGQSPSGSEQGNAAGKGAGADALRKMANGLRQNGTPGASQGNSQSMREMLKKIEEAEQQTGSNGGQQSGLGQSGSGKSGTGEGQSGQGVTPGKDLKPTDPTQGTGGGPGLGPRNNIQGANKSGGGISKVKTNRSGDKRRWSDVWSDRLPKTRRKIDRITGKMGSDGEAEQLPTRSEGKGGAVKTPYYEVYESYKKDAEDAIAKENVPPAYKQPVKNYFESLKP